MAYDEYLGERISSVLERKKVRFYSKKMIGGLCFLVDDKMLCGIHIDKKYNDSLLMARVGEKNMEQLLSQPHVLPMDFTGRPMKGYVFVTPESFDADQDLEKWLQLCLDFNPEAKASTMKKKPIK